MLMNLTHHFNYLLVRVMTSQMMKSFLGLIKRLEVLE